jgi:hypothetical protein
LEVAVSPSLSARFARPTRGALLAAGSALLAAGLLAGPASAARRPHIPPPPPPPLSRSAPPGVHSNHVRVFTARRGRGHVRHKGARLASLPPVNSATLSVWRTGKAWCDPFHIDAQTWTMTDFVYSPYANEGPFRPGSGFVRMYWQAGMWLWDPARNQWVAGPKSGVNMSNPMTDFDYWFTPYGGSDAIPIRPTRAYGYTWVQAWWHYTATYDQSMSGTGGSLYTGTHYLQQTSDGPMANGGCWWG